MILPGLIGHSIFLWGWLFSIVSFFFFCCFFNQRPSFSPCPHSYILCFYGCRPAPFSISAARRADSELCMVQRGLLARMVSVLTLGGGWEGGREGVRVGAEAKANAGDLGLGGGAVRTDGTHVSRGSQKGKDRLHSFFIFFFFFSISLRELPFTLH